MWRKSKQVERVACDRLLADMGTVLQYRDELSEIGPVLTRLAGWGYGVGMPSVQHFALQQQLASLTAMMADHEDAILELERQVASLEPGVQSLDSKVRELGMLLSESMSVVEGRVNVMDEDFKEFLERRTAEITSEVHGRMVQVERLAFQDTISLHDSVHQSATVLRDSLSKLENRVDKVMVRVSALDELHEPSIEDRISELERKVSGGCVATLRRGSWWWQNSRVTSSGSRPMCNTTSNFSGLGS